MAATCSTLLLIPALRVPAQTVLRVTSLYFAACNLETISSSHPSQALDGENKKIHIPALKVLKLTAIAVGIIGTWTSSSTLLLTALAIDTLHEGLYQSENRSRDSRTILCYRVGINIFSGALMLAPSSCYRTSIAIYGLIQGGFLIYHLKHLVHLYNQDTAQNEGKKRKNLKECVQLTCLSILNATSMARSSLYLIAFPKGEFKTFGNPILSGDLFWRK